MSALTDLAGEIQTQLQLLVASNTVIDLTNQRDSDGSVDSTNLAAVCNHAARGVQRKLGRTVDDSDNDAVDFGVRIALLLMVTMFSCTLTQDGAAYTAGVYSELAEEAKARRQALDGFELTEDDEDFSDEDARWPEETWDGQ